jgi:predicted naringenin-chalcone synthase
MTAMPTIRHIACRVPRIAVTQQDALAFMLRHLKLTAAEQAFLSRIYQASAIERRHTVIEDFAPGCTTFSFFKGPQGGPEPGTAQRNALFARHAGALATEVVRDLLRDAGEDPAAITHIVTASCTGFAAPGFDCQVVSELGLPTSVQRFHIGFMGCFAAFPALRLADHICRSEPAARVLIICLELCTLHFTASRDPGVLVANSLFADGAAAALVSAAPDINARPLYALRKFSSRILPSSADDMTWIVGDHGFEMRLSAAVPRLIEAHLNPLLEGQCRAAGIQPSDVRHWAIHPGGRAILDKSAVALGVAPDRLAASYSVLRDYGNMSSATILFVLSELARTAGPGPVFSIAFGPGLTAESALLERL